MPVAGEGASARNKPPILLGSGSTPPAEIWVPAAACALVLVVLAGFGLEAAGWLAVGLVLSSVAGVARVHARTRRHDAGTKVMLENKDAAIEAAHGQIRSLTRYAEVCERDIARAQRDLAGLAYAVSHDLREPLRAVAGFVEALDIHCLESDDEAAREFVRYALEATGRMEDLLDDVLRFSRVGRGERPQRAVDVAELVDEVSGRALVGHRDDGAITRSRLPVVLGDRHDLSELFTNLIDNAVKFGGPNPHVHVSARRVEGGWEFRVRDQGIGIAPVHWEKIFEIFGRLHTPREYPGNGIGLAVARRAVESAGGWIRVDSDVGAGTTFIAWLPERRSPGRATMR